MLRTRRGAGLTSASGTGEIAAAAPVSRSSAASVFFGESSDPGEKDQLTRQIGIVALGNAARAELARN